MRTGLTMSPQLGTSFHHSARIAWSSVAARTVSLTLLPASLRGWERSSLRKSRTPASCTRRRPGARRLDAPRCTLRTGGGMRRVVAARRCAPVSLHPLQVALRDREQAAVHEFVHAAEQLGAGGAHAEVGMLGEHLHESRVVLRALVVLTQADVGQGLVVERADELVVEQYGGDVRYAGSGGEVAVVAIRIRAVSSEV